MPLGVSLCAQLACSLEACARKAGNVHPQRDFADLRFTDFLASAAALGPVMEAAANQPVGKTILDSVIATRRVASTNTNLGIILLLAPLAATPVDAPLRPGVEQVLDQLTLEDARQVFAAIRLARPGGMGAAAEQDVAAEPTLPLRDIMRLAADRDAVARQYANGFQEVFDIVLPALVDGLTRLGNLEAAIMHAHLVAMWRVPDTLIARKRGRQEAEAAARRAETVLCAGWPGEPKGAAAFRELDAWLTEAGNARNPGTSADLVTAGLFAALREGMLPVPFTMPWNSANAL
jgi:triphosphoribosyl-dephospho-CoA synthase